MNGPDAAAVTLPPLRHDAARATGSAGRANRVVAARADAVTLLVDGQEPPLK